MIEQETMHAAAVAFTRADEIDFTNEKYVPIYVLPSQCINKLVRCSSDVFYTLFWYHFLSAGFHLDLNLTLLSAFTESLLKPKNLSFNATVAFKAYSNIKDLIDNAEDTAKEAGVKANEAVDLVRINM